MKLCIFASVLSMSIVSISFADNAQEKGLAIATQVEKKDSGWGDSSARLKMVLRNQQGEESVRTIRLKTLEMSGDGDKSMSIFDDPRDVKGTAFLSFSHAIKPDEQWLYLPALKRVKRISSANKSGPFMGSQFSYEDLASFEVDKYRYKFLRNEKLDSYDTFVVENTPEYPHSGYARQIVWIDSQRYVPLKVEYYDRKNELLKTLKFGNYTQYLNRYWRANEQIMENHQNGKTTLLTWDNYQFRNGFTERNFERNSLKRSR